MHARAINGPLRPLESPRMSLLRLYTRVLHLLGKEARLGWILAGANLLLAGAQFAEPVLFGRIVDVLSGKPSANPLGSSSAWPLLAAWRRSACSRSDAVRRSRCTPIGWHIA